jgi:hypothetical protein
MPGKPYPHDILKQAQEVSSAWAQISTTLAFGTLNAAALTADITSLTSIQSQIASLELQLTDLRNKREAASIAAWDKVKRVRAGVKANYGDDSSQYELIGGTRTSDRKSPARRLTPA